MIYDKMINPLVYSNSRCTIKQKKNFLKILQFFDIGPFKASPLSIV